MLEGGVAVAKIAMKGSTSVVAIIRSILRRFRNSLNPPDNGLNSVVVVVVVVGVVVDVVVVAVVVDLDLERLVVVMISVVVNSSSSGGAVVVTMLEVGAVVVTMLEVGAVVVTILKVGAVVVTVLEVGAFVLVVAGNVVVSVSVTAVMVSVNRTSVVVTSNGSASLSSLDSGSVHTIQSSLNVSSSEENCESADALNIRSAASKVIHFLINNQIIIIRCIRLSLLTL